MDATIPDGAIHLPVLAVCVNLCHPVSLPSVCRPGRSLATCSPSNCCWKIDSMEANTEALSNSYEAIELDPSFASAYGLAAWCYAQHKVNGWVTDRVHDIVETARLARRAAKSAAVCLASTSASTGTGTTEELRTVYPPSASLLSTFKSHL